MADIAYPLAILAITHSPALAGLFAAVQGLGLLLAGLPAGALADRYDSRRIVIITETARAVVTAAVAVRSMPSAHSITRCRSWSPRARSWSRSSPRR